jgi:hypothetical protein
VAAKLKIPYYTVRRNGRGFWEPRPHMRALGFYCVPCGGMVLMHGPLPRNGIDAGRL